jgi:hypothetical protein
VTDSTFIVITPPSYRRLTTIDAAREVCGVTVNTSDGSIQRLIDQASSLIASFTHRDFGIQTVQESYVAPTMWQGYVVWNQPSNYYNMDPNPKVLRLNPVNSIVSVTEDGVALVGGDDYEVDLRAGLLYRLFSGLRGDWWRSVVIQYVVGWNLPEEATPNLPADVESVCLALVRAAWFSRSRDPFLRTETTEGVGTVQYQIAAPAIGMSIDPSMGKALSPYLVTGY